MERILPHRRGHVPSVPNLSPSKLKALRQIFDLRHYNKRISVHDSSEPDILKILFGQGLPVERDQAQRTFHPLGLDSLIESGLLYEEDNKVNARFRAQRYNDLICFSDFLQWETDKGFVLSIGPAGNYLALLTIRRPAESTLDLGCGCGIQSLLAARFSNKVIATDINPRALALTRLNAELNDIHNIETRQGSYFEPVKDQYFDLIVANLPYVITPEKRLIYRTVDQPGDTGTRELLKEIPSHLNEGGFAQVLINWIHNKDQDPSEPIQGTIENTNVDAWLIHNGSKEPDQYAELWLKQQIQENPHKAQKTKQNWSRWYQKNKIEQIALGAITLRRRSNSRNWFCSATVNKTLEDTGVEQFMRLFAAQDYLQRIENQTALLDEVFEAADLGFTGDDAQPIAYANHGSQFEWRVHPVTKTVVHNLDGTNTLGKSIEAACHSLGLSAKESQNDILEDIQKLLELGMVVPVDINQ